MYEMKGYRTESGAMKTVMVGPAGRKYLPILVISGNGLTVEKVPLTEQRYITDLPGKERPIRSVLRQYGGIRRRLGATKAATRFLSAARKQAAN